MLSALVRRVRAHFDHRDQLAIVFESCEMRSADELFVRLKQQGLRGVHEVKLTRNRRTMVSIAQRTLRVQEGFLNAPSTVHQAIADFVMARTRRTRAESTGPHRRRSFDLFRSTATALP